MTSQPVIRYMRLRDLPNIRQLAKLVYGDGDCRSTPYYIDGFCTDQGLVCSIGDMVVGAAFLKSSYSDDDAEYYMTEHVPLEEIFVHPDFQRQGIGSKMVRAMCDIAPDSMKVCSVGDIDTLFFKSMGFIPFARWGTGNKCDACILRADSDARANPQIKYPLFMPAISCESYCGPVTYSMERNKQRAIQVSATEVTSDMPSILTFESCERISRESLGGWVIPCYKESSPPCVPFIRNATTKDSVAIWKSQWKGRSPHCSVTWEAITDICSMRYSSVCVAGSEIVGVMLVRTLDITVEGSADPPKKGQLIVMAWVDPHFRRQGIARSMVQATIDRALGPVYIDALLSTPEARGFYIATGFELVHTVQQIPMSCIRLHYYHVLGNRVEWDYTAPFYLVHKDTKTRDIPPPHIHAMRQSEESTSEIERLNGHWDRSSYLKYGPSSAFPDLHTTVYTIDEDVVGFVDVATIALKEEAADDKPSLTAVFIAEVMVHPDHKDHGIERKLVQETIDTAQKSVAVRISDDYTRDFYASMGFAIQKQLSGLYPMTNDIKRIKEEAYLMVHPGPPIVPAVGVDPAV